MSGTTMCEFSPETHPPEATSSARQIGSASEAQGSLETQVSPETEGPLETVRDRPSLRRRLAMARQEGKTIVFVPTMGALHEGHLSLIRRARELGDLVVASIFVNPTQFGDGEDLESYPRDHEKDARLLARAGCGLLFLPSVETIYPSGHSTWVDVEGPSRGFEGDERPGHFRGVATVVAQLFQLVQPNIAVFGQKDAQQLAVVRKMVRDLHVPVHIVSASIVREPDGLAMSSRNVYLSAEQRLAATVLHRSLRTVEEGLRQTSTGRRVDAETIRAQISRQVATEPLAKLDYVAVVRAQDFRPVTEVQGEIVIALAVRFGDTRLLDNLHLNIDSTAES